MEVRLHDDLAAFTQITRPLPHGNLVRHTVAVTLLRSGPAEDVAFEPAR
jgi:hypothetical protein